MYCRTLWEAATAICDAITAKPRFKVDAIRNQHPYVINYVSAKRGKIFDSREKKIFGGGSRTIFSTKGEPIPL
jgi:hypothetical protein